jgi:MoaA/NifB/PqqE/SkfB family radical SAM enzyme
MCQIPEKNDKAELSTEQCKRLIRDAARLCPESIVFSGGEPLVRSDIFELMSLVHELKINTCLTSNGTLIDEAIAERLAASGIGVVNISLEGPEVVHDVLRGQGSFKRALKALEILSAKKIETTIATIVCRQNYQTLSDVMDLARRHGVSSVKFQPFSDIFLIDKNKRRDFFISSELLADVQASLERVMELARSYGIETNPKGYLLDLASYLCDLRPPVKEHSCRALWTSCPISAQGDVFLCWVLSDKPLGNIAQGSLLNIWNSDAHDRLRQDVLKTGCCGCLMSCYDRNFVPRGYKLLKTFNVAKFKKIQKKRFYFRAYQYFRYMGLKIARVLLDQVMVSRRKEDASNKILAEIRSAQDNIQKKLDYLKNG